VSQCFQLRRLTDRRESDRVSTAPHASAVARPPHDGPIVNLDRRQRDQKPRYHSGEPKACVDHGNMLRPAQGTFEVLEHLADASFNLEVEMKKLAYALTAVLTLAIAAPTVASAHWHHHHHHWHHHHHHW
jgi:hypothetical protein